MQKIRYQTLNNPSNANNYLKFRIEKMPMRFSSKCILTKAFDYFSENTARTTRHFNFSVHKHFAKRIESKPKSIASIGTINMTSLNSAQGDKLASEYDISSMRCPYLTKRQVINEDYIDKDPIQLFKTWFDSAKQCSDILEPNAMCLATATKDGYPSARYVLLKSFGKDGFVFFTNYDSRKGKEMAENPNVAVVFYWESLKKSVRIEGQVSKIPVEQSDEYFHSRPRESQIGACVSKQSSVVASRQALEDINDQLTKQYENKEIPRPNVWGGYLIAPKKFEFWQGQSNRLHDRLIFRKPSPNETTDEIMVHSAKDGWVFERLAP